VPFVELFVARGGCETQALRQAPLRLSRFAVAALLLALAAEACGDASAAPRASVPQAPFRDAVHVRDIDGIIATLADDIVFWTPVLDEPIQGKERVARLFRVLNEVFDEIRFVEEFSNGADAAALIFNARVGAQPVEGVDLLHFDPEGHIATFKVTVRPLAGMQALASAVGPHLGEILQ
jgi:hypothetical protein